MIVTETDRLLIRNWRSDDIDLFHEINSDPQVMEFFPFRRDREQALELMHKIQRGIAETGFGIYALERKSDSAPIGFGGLAIANIEPLMPADTVEVGWRLATRFWGKGYASEAGGALLRVGFEERDLEEVVSFAVTGNRRSIAVMDRIGMAHDAARDFDHPCIPHTHPHLKRHVLYAVTSGQGRLQQRA